ncbi:fumarylacetoacetate hydrolase family protein [Elizabethkingia sp. JS20170427COW]|uniref:fumarylacetoacetate hydrolase family protein n=1 Tax=Elizabethkingia sp. JS20170427COW TaxID=2583851 RepID=UPI001110B7DA|nr:fumarylacetoacetate hydrolase family protein [Elizabethkingia sp. JS20170427COW]QCX52840.1 fumarylacetoacetate hydrolase family protein [Elizabethkingia sp. JS20170427COW]
MKIICVGRNYKAHAQELQNEIPTEPVLFIKPDTAILKGNDFYIPEFSSEIHYEAELVVKISKGGKYITKANAHKHYEQIALGIDFTARDLQSQLKAKGLPWEKAKGFDGSAVVSSFFPISDFNRDEIKFQMLKNKQLVQSGNTKEMIFDIDQLISYISEYFTLRVGDLIFTGTPAGVGAIVENDILEGMLENQAVFNIKIQ